MYRGRIHYEGASRSDNESARHRHNERTLMIVHCTRSRVNTMRTAAVGTEVDLVYRDIGRGGTSSEHDDGGIYANLGKLCALKL